MLIKIIIQAIQAIPTLTIDQQRDQGLLTIQAGLQNNGNSILKTILYTQGQPIIIWLNNMMKNIAMTIIAFLKKAYDAFISFCKKVIQWVKEKILLVKNKFSDE